MDSNVKNFDLIYDDEYLIKDINENFYRKIKFNYIDLKIVKKLINKNNLLDNENIPKIIKRKIHYSLLYLKRDSLSFKKNISLNNNKYFQLIICAFLITIKNVQLQYNIFENIASLLTKMYKYNILSFQLIFSFFEFYMSLLKKEGILLNDNVKNLVFLTKFLKKVIKVSNNMNLEKNKKELINERIHKILEMIFEKNNQNTIENVKFCKKVLKEWKILDILKLSSDYYNNNILDKENKNIIKNNLINLLTNSFNYNHLNYFFSISKKFILNFKNNKKNKNYISLINEIFEFLIEVQKNEKAYEEKNTFYFDKYFIFDFMDPNNGFKTTPITFNNQCDLGLSIIFSFYAIKAVPFNNEPQTLLSINNANKNQNIFKICLIKDDLYLFISRDENKNILLMKNIKYDTYNICSIYYDQNIFYFSLNEKYEMPIDKIDLKDINEIYIEVGNDSLNKEKYNGFIGPVLIFNSILDKVLVNRINNLKGKYYLIAEMLEQEKMNINIDNIFFSYEINKGIVNKEEELYQLINEVKKSLGNLILYINPSVIINNLNFKDKYKFHDYQFYNNCLDETNDVSKQKIYYEFTTEEEISNLFFIQNSFYDFFMKNNGFIFIILNIESIYNYLLVTNDIDKKYLKEM